MSWRDWSKKFSFRGRKDVPTGLFVTCQGCQRMIPTKNKEEGMDVCPECDYHFQLPTLKRISLLVDPDSFRELFTNVAPDDPLAFSDRRPYLERIREAQESTRTNDAVTVGIATIKQRPVCLGVMDFSFMAGSMGSVVGEKITRLIELALQTKRPLIIVAASGGARMQEGAFSLMQMAKTSCALARLRDAHVPFISILTNPTTAGVLASFAGLGDIIIAEPKALIGFTGPRVIKETIKQDLPEGFQRSEFLLERGMIDMIVHRSDLRERLATILNYFPAHPEAEQPIPSLEQIPIPQAPQVVCANNSGPETIAKNTHPSEPPDFPPSESPESVSPPRPDEEDFIEDEEDIREADTKFMVVRHEPSLETPSPAPGPAHEDNTPEDETPSHPPSPGPTAAQVQALEPGAYPHPGEEKDLPPENPDPEAPSPSPSGKSEHTSEEPDASPPSHGHEKHE